MPVRGVTRCGSIPLNMVLNMTAKHSNVLLPMAMPTRNELRHALASVIRAIATAITGSLHKLSLATDDDSDGGSTVTHRELANMAQDLRAAQRVINGLLARAERLGIAA